MDLIFKEYQAPITFAPDHCLMSVFSASAVHCSCLKDLEKARNKFEEKLNTIDPLRLSKNKEVQKYRKELQRHYLDIRTNLLKLFITGVRYFFSPYVFKLNDNIHFDKKRRVWTTSEGVDFMKDIKIRKITKSLGLKWSYIKKEPQLQDGRSIWFDQCPHLKMYIQEKFGIHVATNQFQHWNGGVFLFDDESHDFLNRWFDKTMLIFQDPKWKTRDQGTLIATVWELGLQNHPMLGKQWNLIADYNNPFLQWKDEGQVSLSSTELVRPNLIHVYHHFGDKSWGFWNQLIERVNSHN